MNRMRSSAGSVTVTEVSKTVEETKIAEETKVADASKSKKSDEKTDLNSNISRSSSASSSSSTKSTSSSSTSADREESSNFRLAYRTAVSPPEKPKKVPVIEPTTTPEPVRVAVPRTQPPRPPPIVTEVRPLIIGAHLVPSLPVGLFEVIAEAIEAATNIPVSILYEARTDRPVAKDVVDIAFLPAGEDWQGGDLLPISFVFEHRLNKNFSPAVYADVVVATDRAPHVEGIMDLRGHRCALPDRRRQIGAATILFNHLRSKGEGPAFFGNTLDANSQMAALQMVAGKQVEVCILESPVIKYHRKSLPGVYSLHILTSLGPLPPYPIMVSKKLSKDIVDKIKNYLLNMRNEVEWMEKLAPYSVMGFAEYNKSSYDLPEIKSVATSAPYY